MNRIIRFAVVILLFAVSAFAQDAKKAGPIAADQLKKVIPTDFFFEGQVAPVQQRNAVAVRTQAGKIVSAGLVDNSGYSSDVAQKYQGFFITETKIVVAGKPVAAGEYGFGFSSDGKFRIMDLGGNEVVNAASQQDANLKRAVPLQVVADGNNYRLYAGKKYVTIETQ
jgi:hypothetical protein